MAAERGESRKLAAILVADVVGYSRLAGANEDRILARLRTLRSDLIDPIISVHHGRIVKRTGDGSILEFRSVVDAVCCALEVQTGMVERNAGLLPEKRIEFRIGIHLGDVVEEADGDLMGDGVNVAARLEGICEPGQGRRLSAGQVTARASGGRPRAAKPQEHRRAGARLSLAPGRACDAKTAPAGDEDARRLGALACARLRARSRSVWSRRLRMACGLRAAFHRRLRRRQASAGAAAFDRRSAVREPERRQGAGLFRRRRHRRSDDRPLSHSRQLRNRSRHSLRLQGQGRRRKSDRQRAGRALRLEGSVRRAGETVTVNAQLISTTTGAHVWADRFEGDRSKLGELQVEVVSRLANSLGAELVKSESLRAMRERPTNPDAVDLAMQGWAAYYKGWDSANVNEALGYFERALRLDPGLMRARVGLALMLVWRAHYFGGAEPTKDIARAESLVASALAAEPNNAQAHYAKAELHFYRKQFDDTLSELKAVLENDRNVASAHAFSGAVLAFLGRPAETFPYEETALRLGPRDTNRHVWESNICLAHALMGQRENAVEWCQKSIATNPGLPFSYVLLAAANAWLGHNAEAKAAVAALLKLNPGFTVQDYANFNWSDNPTFKREYGGIVEGLRKAGLPEGEKKTD